MIICTRCNTNSLHEVPDSNPISRRDNKTRICLQCGDDENELDYRILTLKELPSKKNDWWHKWRQDAKFQLLLGPEIAARYCRNIVINAIGEAPDEKVIAEFIDAIQLMEMSNDEGGDMYGK